jgi:hypothetical protein
MAGERSGLLVGEGTALWLLKVDEVGIELRDGRVVVSRD